MIRDSERLLKLIILYNDDDDSDDVEKNENMVLFYPCSIKKGENSYPKSMILVPIHKSILCSWANRTNS
jgi:hypothetical protein